MKLLFQADDYGITEAVTLGIVKGIKEGLIRNTGLFTNMNSSEFAASFIPELPQCNFGIDINLVAGKPVSDADKVPNLIDEKGYFITSLEQFKNNEIVGKEGFATVFKNEPYKYEEVALEVENQILRYKELVGKIPAYIHGHSLMTPVTMNVMREYAKKYDIPFTMDVLEEYDVFKMPTDWNIKPLFKVEDQLNTDVEQNVLNVLKNNTDHETAILVTHPGYVDSDLLEASSYSLIRARDLEMATSQELMDYISENNIELITYKDLLA